MVDAHPDDQLLLAIDPDVYLTQGRQRQLFELADAGASAAAVRLAIREAVYSTSRGVRIMATED